MASLTRRPRIRLSKKRLRVLRRQRARRPARLDVSSTGTISNCPSKCGPFSPLAPAFTRPTYRRFVLLAVAAILTLGGHTICNLLRCLGAARDTPPVITASSPAVLGAGPRRRFTPVILARFAAGGHRIGR